MQTLSIQIQDSYMQQFMDFVKESHSNITVSRDKNLELDPYFYERKRELHQIRHNIKNGESQLVSFADFESRTNQFEKELELKYAN